MMLQSKCKAKVKSLQAFHQAQCKLSHSLTQLQSTNQSKLQNRSSRQSSSITPYEWSLLQSEEKLRQHEDSLAAAACIAEDCRQAQHHAAVFFDWLSSLHKQHGPAESVAQQVSTLHVSMVPVLIVCNSRSTQKLRPHK